MDGGNILAVLVILFFYGLGWRYVQRKWGDKPLIVKLLLTYFVGGFLGVLQLVAIALRLTDG